MPPQHRQEQTARHAAVPGPQEGHVQAGAFLQRRGGRAAEGWRLGQRGEDHRLGRGKGVDPGSPLGGGAHSAASAEVEHEPADCALRFNC